jgi:hypothetical protein
LKPFHPRNLPNFVFPNSHHRKSSVPKLPTGSIVTLAIARDFRRPKLDSTFRDAPALRTCMPEASVHKHGEGEIIAFFAFLCGNFNPCSFPAFVSLWRGSRWLK